MYVSPVPRIGHQAVLTNLPVPVWNFLKSNPIGDVVPGLAVIFDRHDVVIPDLLYVSKADLNRYLVGGHLAGPPEIAVEILSPGSSNEKRDRHIKLNLYDSRGDRRSETGQLDSRENLLGEDRLTTALLRGFEVQVSELFKA